MALENEKLKTDVARDRLDLLKQLNIPEDRIREIATKHVIKPLAELDRAQDTGLIETAEFIEEDDPQEPKSSVAD
jgi:hypothetical protein